MFENQYTSTQIKGDIAFLKYAIKKNQVTLREGTGLKKLIDDCEHYVGIQEVRQEEIKPITILYTLVNSLKNLWINNTDFTIQLRAMNTGQFEYGNPDPSLQHFFKDFEFEIFSASHLINNNVDAKLPQHTVGEDLQYGTIDLQCKHPNTTQQIEQNVKDFTSRLNTTKRYGVFGLAVEDCFNFSERLIFRDENDLNNHLQAKLNTNDAVLEEIFRNSLARATRILGLYTTATFFVLLNGKGLRLIRMTNSVFCFRPDRKEIADGSYKEAYKIVTKFNPHPTWLTIENQTLISISV